LIIVTYQSGQDAGTSETLDFTINGANASSLNISSGLSYRDDGKSGIIPTNGASIIPVGAIVPLSAKNPGNDVIVVTGRFFGRWTQVIFDTSL
jgi:hypothetical protein